MLNIELKVFLLAKEYKEIMAKVSSLTKEEQELFKTMIDDNYHGKNE
ncbi:MAG: hypothetical protein H7X94_11075 [Vallitaleaceae bacterium]|nr:hypothetical protein [Vallitaleaceae bacterium]